jgi:hypothetical protein
MQLKDRGELEDESEKDARAQPEYIRCSLFPGVVKAKNKLEINDQFKEDKV